MSLADYNTEAGRVTVRKQPPNVFTVLLLVSVVSLAIGCLFLFLELQSYGLSVTVSPDARVPPAPPPSGAMMPMKDFRFGGVQDSILLARDACLHVIG